MVKKMWYKYAVSRPYKEIKLLRNKAYGTQSRILTNGEGGRLVDIAKILGRMNGSRCGSFICKQDKPLAMFKDGRSAHLFEQTR